MSDLLAIGASGIKAYSRALSVVGDNIANAQTEGYVRRDVRLAEAPAAGDIVLSRNSIRPGGVLEGTLIGVSLLLFSVVGGGWIDHSDALREYFDMEAVGKDQSC